jgi:hypothetical protein
MGCRRGAGRVLVGKLKEINRYEEVRIAYNIMLKWNFTK